ncbi:hypothetical protein RBB50_009307 [Rhinocladiella similis]
MVAWSICNTLMGVVHNFGGLITARIFLGLTEGGLFPGVAFYITMWYKRHECGYRISLVYSAATVAGAFGGLLARGIMEMRGVAGKPGWSWIFILEGSATFLVAIAAYLLMTDYPSEAKFLTPAERVEVARRLAEDRSVLAEEFDIKYFYHAIQDWKIWLHVLITICTFTPVYSIALFLPTIVSTLGYANETAQLMSVPPYVVACFFCISTGVLADKLRTRGVFMLGASALGIWGMIMTVASTNYHVKYAGCVLAAAGCYSTVPQGVAWNSGNVGGAVKRSVAIALHVGCGNIGGVISAFIFLPKDSPRFVPGFCILISLLSVAFLGSLVMTVYLRQENARRDRDYKAPDDYTEVEKQLEREKGDSATFFRYTV